MTPVRSTGAILCERVDPPQRVYVRPKGRLARFYSDFMGEVTHRNTLGNMVFSVTVNMAPGVFLNCDPSWVSNVIDMAALLELPGRPAAPSDEA